MEPQSPVSMTGCLRYYVRDDNEESWGRKVGVEGFVHGIYNLDTIIWRLTL